MGVVQSIPLCSRGQNKDNNTNNNEEENNNNNEPMPSLQPSVVVSVQPLASVPAPPADTTSSSPKPGSTVRQQRHKEPTSLVNLTATSTDENNERSYSSSLESNPDDNAAMTPTSDSGLEQSSSDELELGSLGARVNKKSEVTAAQERPFSAAAKIASDAATDTGGESEGSSNAAARRLPMENHDTCEEDGESSTSDEDPLERPPEPTVPDERVDCDDSSSSSSGDNQDTNDKANKTNIKGIPPRRKKTGAGDTTSAISNLLSEIVGDRPYQEGKESSFSVIRAGVER